MGPAPISVRCDCGASRPVPYGEVWACEECGRRWNTAQIPADEYWGVMRDVRRYKLVVAGVAIVLCAAILPLAVAVSQRFFFLLLLVVGAWAFYVMPFLRRRIRRRLADLPKWTLHPE